MITPFLLEHQQHIPLLLPFFEWQDLECLSCCSARIAASRLRDAFFERMVVVIPEGIGDQASARAIVSRLSASTRHVALFEPTFLPLLGRLPRLRAVQVNTRGHAADEVEHTDEHTTIELTSGEIECIWRLPALVQLEVLAPVENLEQLLRDLLRLQHLKLVLRHSVSTLAPVAHMRYLKSLDVHGSRLEDVSALEELKQLVSLRLASRSVQEIVAITNLENLEILDISGCNVMELAPLASLTRLRSLAMEDTPVEELTPLQASNLQYLAIARTKIKHLGPLDTMSGTLRYLDISGCTLLHTSALCSLEKLETLLLQRTAWPSAGDEPDLSSVLLRMPRLLCLDARLMTRAQSALQLVRLDTMGSFDMLQQLHVVVSGLERVNDLVALPSLVHLTMDWQYAHSHDIPRSAVIHPHLHTLHILRVCIHSLHHLERAQCLRELRLIDVEVANGDLSPLRALSQLETLEVTCAMLHGERRSSLPVYDLTPLRFLPRLTRLDLSYTNLGSVQPLGSLVSLRSLDLSWTNADDLSPLHQLRHLECVCATGTDISSFPCGAFGPRLRELALPRQVDCLPIRRDAPNLRKLLHPDRNCLWAGHGDRHREDATCAQS